jgi:hypothetical protein
MSTAAPATQTSKTVTVKDVQRVAVPGLGNVTATSGIVGSSGTQSLLATINGLDLTTDTPAVVLVQPRQSVNQLSGFSDEFAVQVIDTSTTELQVLVRRVDTNSGWGQELRLDIFILDSVLNA